MEGLPSVDDPRVIVGLSFADDAGVVRLDDERALVQTLDFFTPIVDDPRTFGYIAAVNALSDVWAMGGSPLTAMNILCFPEKTLPESVLAEILAGGQAAVRDAGALLVGGHSVKDAGLKFGLSVTGMVHPERAWANAGAEPGDALVLTKELGTGILTTARRCDAISEAELQPAIRSMMSLNRDACQVAAEGTVNAATDITGNGLAGHAWEMACGSSARLTVRFGALPLLPGALRAAEDGHITGGAAKNRRYVGAGLSMGELSAVQQDLVLDPQTSGGLLLAVPATEADALVARLEQAGVVAARVGEVSAGEPAVVFEP